MRILALETSLVSGSVALLEHEQPLGQVQLSPHQRSAKALTPAIARLLNEQHCRPRDIQLIVVTSGPGSFTGLRVGVTVAKVLAYATGAEVIGVNTLEALAVQAPLSSAIICPVLDAQRQQLFAAQFHRTQETMIQCIRQTQIVDRQCWLNELPHQACVIGNGLKPLVERLPSHVRVADERLWTVSAVTVGLVGYRHYQQGQRDDPWSLMPQYFRGSAAEEKRAEG